MGPASAFWIRAIWFVAVVGASGFLIWGPGGTNFDQDSAKRFNPDVSYKVVVSRSGLTLREAPSLAGKSIENLPFGTKVQIIPEPHPVSVTIDNIPSWFQKIRWKGTEGYVFSGYLVPAFFDLETIPLTLEDALRPWLLGKTTTISWLNPYDVWVLESQVWKYRTAQVSADFPRAPAKLLNWGIFVPGSQMKEPLVHYVLALPEYLVTVRPSMEGVSVTFEPDYALESLVKEGVRVNF